MLDLTRVDEPMSSGVGESVRNMIDCDDIPTGNP